MQVEKEEQKKKKEKEEQNQADCVAHLEREAAPLMVPGSSSMPQLSSDLLLIYDDYSFIHHLSTSVFPKDRDHTSHIIWEFFYRC